MLSSIVSMKTISITFLALIALSYSEEANPQRQRRGFDRAYHNQLNLDSSLEINGYDGTHLPLQESQLYGHGIDKYLPIASFNPVEIDLKVNLPPHKAHYGIPLDVSNAVDKPVQEAQEIVPPQSFGTAIIPQMPPPATPVNAAASNVPANSGAVFLGSGSLGVVSLGNGAYALGSGSLGYSGNRAQPRPSSMVPVYPPLAASPNLIPAAVPSQPPPQISFQPIADNFNFDHPLFNMQPQQIDRNGYEYLPPNRIGFGSPNPRPPRLRTTQSFATPTALQVQQPPPQFPPSSLNFGQRIPNLYSLQAGY